MSLIEMRWKPAPSNGWTFRDATMLSERIGGPEVWDRGEIKMGEDGMFSMHIPTVNMVTRWLAEDPRAFQREAMRGVNRDALVEGPLFRIRIW